MLLRNSDELEETPAAKKSPQHPHQVQAQKKPDSPPPRRPSNNSQNSELSYQKSHDVAVPRDFAPGRRSFLISTTTI